MMALDKMEKMVVDPLVQKAIELVKAEGRESMNRMLTEVEATIRQNWDERQTVIIMKRIKAEWANILAEATRA